MKIKRKCKRELIARGHFVASSGNDANITFIRSNPSGVPHVAIDIAWDHTSSVSDRAEVSDYVQAEVRKHANIDSLREINAKKDDEYALDVMNTFLDGELP